MDLLDLEVWSLGLCVQIGGLDVSDQEFVNWGLDMLGMDIDNWTAHL